MGQLLFGNDKPQWRKTPPIRVAVHSLDEAELEQHAALLRICVAWFHFRSGLPGYGGLLGCGLYTWQPYAAPISGWKGHRFSRSRLPSFAVTSLLLEEFPDGKGHSEIFFFFARRLVAVMFLL